MTVPLVDAATSVAIGVLDQVQIGPAPLIVDEPSGALAQALAGRGSAPVTWLRFAGGSVPARPWPDSGPFSSAFVRLPKSKDAFDLALHAAAGALVENAPLIVMGANDEGVKASARHLEAVADGPTVLDARRHCRVLMGRRRANLEAAKLRLTGWRRAGEIAVAGKPRPWISYPGVFARGGLDVGTTLLLEHLPALPAHARVLDFACGTGIIAAAVLARHSDARVQMIDADAIAIEAARENVPGATSLVGSDLSDLGGARFDAILSNPPIHDGVREDHGVLKRLLTGTPRRLRPGGMLVIVTQRRVRATSLVREALGNSEVVAETPRFQVIVGRAN
jgi:16S rRNA (guanine1207-N2)-methyltransferase